MLAGTAAALAANVIWGFNYIPAKVALTQVSPFALLLIRLAISAPLCLVVLWARGVSLSDLFRHWREGVRLALFAVLGSQVFFLLGLSRTMPSHASFIYALLPIFTAVLAIFLIRERVSFRRASGIVIAFAGAFILTSEGGLTLDSKYLMGDLLTLAGAVAWACYTVLSKPVVARLGSMRTITLVFAFGLPMTLPLTVVPALTQPWLKVDALGWASVAYFVLLGTFLVNLIFQAAVKRLPATLVAVFSYFQPILATLFSVLLLEEELTFQFVVAAVLILTGLVTAREATRRETTAVSGKGIASKAK